MSNPKYKCPRCNEKLEKSVIESNNQRLVLYCKNESHKILRIHVFLGKKIRKTIRPDRMIEGKNKVIDSEYNLRNLSCICGKNMYYSKSGSNPIAGIVKFYCGDPHKRHVTITSKLYPNEPMFHELMEIVFE